KMCCVYDLWSFEHRHMIAIKVFTPRDNPSVPSVADLWPAADWHEREAYDMFGIDFPGHSDLRRILCADDWEGFPLRKDYQFPREYHGIPASVELDWQHKPDYPKCRVIIGSWNSKTFKPLSQLFVRSRARWGKRDLHYRLN